MIRLGSEATRLVEAHLSSAVVDARLEVVSRLGSRILGRFVPDAGTIRWDATQRRGTIDVDAVIDMPTLTATHPAAALGQVLEAWWTWPMIGVSVPCGYWLVSEAERLDGHRWRVAAEPEGPSRLDRACWWETRAKTLAGTAPQQVQAVVAEAGVPWTPDVLFPGRTFPSLVAEPGERLLETLERVLGQAGAQLRPSRRDRGVVLGESRGPHWSWSEGSPTVVSVAGSAALQQVPNRVTVWTSETVDDVEKVTGWSEPLRSGPRRWDGPYGRIPEVVKVEPPATTAQLREQAKNLLRRRQEEAASVELVMRADPRVEVGDIATITSASDGTDCTARVTSLSLNAGTGLASVTCSALSGVVAGVPISLTST